MNVKIALIVILAALLMAVVTFYNYKPYIEDSIPECGNDIECVPEQCCHPISCVPKAQEPDCTDVFCTEVCEPGTMDCGQGYCECKKGVCTAVIEQE